MKEKAVAIHIVEDIEDGSYDLFCPQCDFYIDEDEWKEETGGLSSCNNCHQLLDWDLPYVEKCYKCEAIS